MGYYLDVSWIEYGPAAGSWKEAKNLLTDAAFEQEPDLLQAAGRARGLIQEAGRSHEPRPALIVVRAAEKEEAGSLPDELNGQGSIRAVISMLAEADADALNAENMETGLRIPRPTKSPGFSQKILDIPGALWYIVRALRRQQVGSARKSCRGHRQFSWIVYVSLRPFGCGDFLFERGSNVWR